MSDRNDRAWQPGDPERRRALVLTEADKEDLRDFLREAVMAGLRDHPCRFGEEQAKVLHQVADRLTPDQLTALTLIASSVNGVAARIGQVLVWGLLAAIVAALVLLMRSGMLPDV